MYKIAMRRKMEIEVQFANYTANYLTAYRVGFFSCACYFRTKE